MLKKRVLVLGAGLIGRPMALDLQRNDEFQVSVVDISSKNLSRFEGSNIQCHQADFREPSSWFSLTESHDYFINAVPGFIGFST
ncbi:MAG TPA: saccharopine dehydrogenase NADP-binding domain-containing protein, partial [Bacteroidales bacterium]|nr:saccharopine dehydrogenase NADP-binding domain-containing protein [Bacteroidales bacterium]